ncbi:MAG TPA: substrate-binding domain-containing protein [Gammaproteobacteria bacterium]|nr:substrate-binding domain-containing protein [Gammaproteobacteria bacterium]
MRFRTFIAALALAAFAHTAAAQGGGVRVLCSNGMKAVFDALRPQIERELGQPMTVEFGTTAALRAKIESGAAFDVAVITTEAVNDLASKGAIAAPSVGALGRSGIGVALRAGAKPPPLATTDDLKKALLAAKSITWVSVGATRPGIERMLEKLGIAKDVQPKVTLTNTVDEANESVTSGRVELALTLKSEIVSAKGLTYAGPLPADVQSYVSFAAGVAAKSAAAMDAARVVATLAARSAAPTYQEKGMELAIAR